MRRVYLTFFTGMFLSLSFLGHALFYFPECTLEEIQSIHQDSDVVVVGTPLKRTCHCNVLSDIIPYMTNREIPTTETILVNVVLKGKRTESTFLHTGSYSLLSDTDEVTTCSGCKNSLGKKRTFYLKRNLNDNNSYSSTRTLGCIMPD